MLKILEDVKPVTIFEDIEEAEKARLVEASEWYNSETKERVSPEEEEEANQKRSFWNSGYFRQSVVELDSGVSVFSGVKLSDQTEFEGFQRKTKKLYKNENLVVINTEGFSANVRTAVGIDTSKLGESSSTISDKEYFTVDPSECWVRWGWFEDNLLSRYYTLVDGKGNIEVEIRSKRRVETGKEDVVIGFEEPKWFDLPTGWNKSGEGLKYHGASKQQWVKDSVTGEYHYEGLQIQGDEIMG